MAQKILPPAPSDPRDADAAAFTLDAPLPPELDFDPIPRVPGGRTKFDPARQRQFIAALAACGSATTAARAVRISLGHVYALRNSAGAESFAAAWDRAVERGARRVLDVLVDHAINGTPEYIYKDGEMVAERRHFNTRAQMWIVAHYLPERFGVAGGLMHSVSGPVGLKRLKENWRKEWDAERWAEAREADARAADSVLTKLNAVRRHFKQTLAADPAKRAAWELLTGPTDWSDFDKLTAYPDHPDNPIHQRRPDMIVTMAAPLGEGGEAVGDVLYGGREEQA